MYISGHVFKRKEMRIGYFGVLIISIIFTACASLPKESVVISQTLGQDLVALHNAHRNMIETHFKKIEGDINSFIDDVYVPYIIHYVLKNELGKYKEGKSSLYGIIETAGKKEGKEEAEEAINIMQELQEGVFKKITAKRNELLTPISEQKTKIITAVNQSYENAIHANNTITAYLQSLQRMRGMQQETLSKLGLGGADTLFTNSLVKISDQVDNAIKEGKNIDFKSDEAFIELEKISNQIKKITN